MDHIRGILFQAVLQHSCHLFRCCICYMYIHISMFNDSTPTHSQQLQLFNLQLLSFDPQATNVQFSRVAQFFLFCETENETEPETDPPNRKPMTVFVAEWALPQFSQRLMRRCEIFQKKVGQLKESCNEKKLVL